jgi:protein TonB
MIEAVAERGELRLWAASAILVLGLHAALGALLVTWHEPIAVGESSDAVVVDLTPFAAPPSETVEDLPAGPKQEEAEQAPPPPPEEKPEQKVEEKIEVPPAPVPPVAALPLPEPETPKPPEPTPIPPAPATTAPPRAQASQAQIQSWYGNIVTQIERHKSYPHAARERGETGVVQLAFSIDREGRVVSSQVVQSSGYPALDQETIETVRRAQPFPTPPANLPGAKFDFTVPVKFNIR